MILVNDISGDLSKLLAYTHKSAVQWCERVLKAPITDPKKKHGVTLEQNKAFREFGEVINAVDPLDYISAVAGVFILRHYQPERFADSQGFQYQVVRAFRSLPCQLGVEGYKKPGDICPKVTGYLYENIANAYHGLIVKVLEQVEETAQRCKAVMLEAAS
ncbi:hypothetical protein [Magnetococcus sp. PR-3]|uniref:hypothetical protein n=1 Tax=Magnetococcus sp. PR-3 TaxID=3120355 RepID=UPI002FCE551C